MSTMLRHSILIILVAVLGMTINQPAHAESPMTVQYVPGWEMAGAPPGTDLSGAETLYVYGPNGYLTPSDAHAALCTGYWFYAAVPAHWLVPLATQAPTTEQACPLQAGWNMIGNPFLTAALLPSGTTAYAWTEGRYELVSAIPLGGAVWIYADAAGSILLRPAPGTTPVQSGPIPPGVPAPTYQLHVGETLELVAQGEFPDVLGVDAHFLALEASTVSNGSTIWRYRAIAPGTTSIVVTLSCYYLQPACLAPSRIFSVEILP